jgi:cyclase
LDVKKDFLGKYYFVYKQGKKKSKENVVEFAHKMQKYGAGEIVIQSIDKDGTYEGYDFDLIKSISENISIPIVALGGAKNYSDFSKAVNYSFASAVAAGSLFVYHGPRKAVLINYPSAEELLNLFNPQIK